MGLSKIFPFLKRREGEQEANNKPTSNTSGTDQAQNQQMNKVPLLEITTSERVWNRAYNALATDKATVGLVEAYVKVLPNAIDPDASAAGEFSLEMETPFQRQASMKAAINRGKAKIETSDKITNATGEVVSFINKFKGVVDVAVSSNPQAALPWAGVCVGLQVS